MVGGESTAGVVLTPLMEPFMEPLVEASSSDVLVRGATNDEARLTTLPIRDHLDLPGELIAGG